MEPDKLPTESDLSQVITTEYAAKNLLAALVTLLKSSSDIDEHKAKQLRKSWEELQQQADVGQIDLTELEAGFEKLREKIHRQVEHRNTRFAETEKLMVQLKQTIRNEELKESQQLEARIISSLNKIRGLSTQRRQKVIGELEALQPKIKKLSSWRHWGTEQAREKIIEEVNQIHEKEKNLEKVAQFIKQAREQWKQWDNSGEGGNKTLYKQFDEACTNAYEPCRKLFDAQRKQRQSASKNREQICRLLETEYEKVDWRNPDWKQLQQLVREQSGRWRKLGAAQFRERKPLQKRYEEIMARFDGPLDRERKRNIKQREELIESVQKLSDVEDTRKSIRELQQLKKQWQVTVSAGRKKEQALWKKFTGAADAVFEKSRESRKELDRQMETNLATKQALCDQITEVVKSGELDASSLSRQIAIWKTEWSDSGRVPKPQIKQIDKRWRDTLATANQALEALNRVDQNLEDQRLFAYAEICRELESAVLSGEAADTDALLSTWQSLDSLPEELMTEIKKRMDNAVEAAADDVERKRLCDSVTDNFDQLNKHLLQLEINLGIDSPAEFSKARMALQIGRLSAAMGKATEEVILDNQALVNAIHLIGPVAPEQREAADRRFKTCYLAMQK